MNEIEEKDRIDKMLIQSLIEMGVSPKMALEIIIS